MELENKTIIVSGASSGIGAAAAKLFASEGASVVLGARRSQEHAIAEEISAQHGKVVYLVGDVTEEHYAQSLADLALKTFGRLDGAFNNAGTVGEMSALPDMSSITGTASCRLT